MYKINKKIWLYPLTLVAFATALASCQTPSSSTTGPVSSFDKPSSDGISSVTPPSSTAPVSSSTHVPVVVISKSQNSVSIKDREVEGYDYKQYFSITVDEKTVAVTDSMIDATEVLAEHGQYIVTCSYQGKTASIIVNVAETVYTVVSSVDRVSIKQKDVASYDFKALFTATMDEETVAITDEMVTSTIADAVGTYSYTVTFGGASKTIEVVVEEDHLIKIIPAYKTKEIALSELSGFDPTSLFSLYVDGKAVAVTPSMVDASALESAEAGKQYKVTMTYTEDNSSSSAEVTVRVVSDKVVAISSKDLTIQPNSGFVDLTSLFEISVGGEKIAVTDSMISGYVDYSKLGDSIITCTYRHNGSEYQKTATVTIATGVDIAYASSDVILVRQGTDAATYAFADDFIVTINGIKFANIAPYLDTSKVDFSAVGTYEVTLTLPYNEGTVTNIVKKITYTVVEKAVSVTLGHTSIILSDDITSYGEADIFSNITVYINNIKQTLSSVDYPDDPIAVYAVITSAPVDCTTPGVYTVTVDIYAYGSDNDPIEVSYTVEVPSDIVISMTGSNMVLEGDTLDPKSLFSISKGGAAVTVTDDMILGKVDTFTPGIYAITVEYEGKLKVFDVIVLEKDIIGTYNTNLDNYGDGMTSGEEEETPVVTKVGQLVISSDMSISISGSKLGNIIAIDATTFQANISSFEHTFHYDNGIMTVIPVNTNKMRYSSSNRPYIFFAENKYEVEKALVIDYSATTSIQNATSTGYYSIYTFQIKDLTTGTRMWYGLKVALVDLDGSNYYYSCAVGEMTVPSDFAPAPDVKATVSLMGKDYTFTMTSATKAVVDRPVEQAAAFTGTYSGLFNGVEATLEVDQYDGFSFYVDNLKVLSVAGGTMKQNIDYGTGIATIVSDDSSDGFYSYKVRLDKEANTFDVIAYSDSYFGKYAVAAASGKYDGGYLFLDGYGTGYFRGDSSTSSKCKITYVVEDGMVKANFIDTKVTYQYGSYAYFYIDSFRNTLIIGKSDVADMIGLQYDSVKVTQGIKLDIAQFTLDAVPESDTQKGLDALLSYFTITDKNGIVADADKVNYIDYSNVDFSTPGFYLVTVKATIDEEVITKYFTFQVNAPIYEGNALVGDYTSEYSSSYKLSIDMYGNATFTYSSNKYVGNVIIDGVNFTFTGTKVGGTATVNVVGKLEVDGVVSATVTGDRSHTCYFASDDIQTHYMGYKREAILRAFIVGEDTYYFLCSSETSIGSPVEVTSLNGIAPTTIGAVISIPQSGGDPIVAKVASLSNAYSGLVYPDANRGTYSSIVASEEDLVLDGFGTGKDKVGVATIGAVSYSYYQVAPGLIILETGEGSNKVVFGYVTLDGNTYTALEKSFDQGLIGTFAALSYSSVSSSSYQITVNEYGVVEYKESSTTYYGLAVRNEHGTYTALCTKTSSTSSVTLTITKMRDGLASVLKNGSKLGSTGCFIADYTDISYVGYKYGNYITSVNIGETRVHLWLTGSSAEPIIVNIETLNNVAFETVGSIFTVKNGEEVLLAKAKYLNPKNTGLGYIIPGPEAGTYAPPSGYYSLELDGFANTDAKVEGVAVYNGINGTYSIFSDGIITLNYESEGNIVSVKVALNTTDRAFELMPATHTGEILGTFKRITTSGLTDNYLLTFDEYGLGSYGSSNGIINYNQDETTFTATLGSNTVSGEVIAPGLLCVTIGSSSYFYVKDAAENSADIYAGESSSANIVYQATIGSNVYYLYQENSSTTYKGVLSLAKGEDSAVELGIEGAVFELKNGDEVVFAAKYVRKSIYSGLIPANVDQRKTFTSTTGEPLFTDGFTTDNTAAKRGQAKLGQTVYSYYYCPSLERTIILYDGEGKVAGYAKYELTGTYELAADVMTATGFKVGDYAGMPSSSTIISIDKFGYITYEEDYFGVINLAEDGLSFTSTVTYHTSSSTVREIQIAATVLDNGVIKVTLSGYDSGTSYYTVGVSHYAGMKNTNYVYSATVDGVTTYYIGYENSSAASNYPGKIEVEILNGIEFGTAGSVFKATYKDADNIEQTFIAKYLKDNGYSGYEIVTADGLEGEYTCDGKDSITINGYGLLTVNSATPVSYSYTVSGNVVTIVDADGQAIAYTLDTVNKTYTAAIAEVNPVEGLKFQATYDFDCPNAWSLYDCTTSFEFKADGTVVIKSSSPDHDSDCPSDYYINHCTFTDTTGTYTRDGAVITVTFKSYTVVFELDSVVSPTKMTCTSTTIGSSVGGYFKVGQVFNVA